MRRCLRSVHDSRICPRTYAIRRMRQYRRRDRFSRLAPHRANAPHATESRPAAHLAPMLTQTSPTYRIRRYSHVTIFSRNTLIRAPYIIFAPRAYAAQYTPTSRIRAWRAEKHVDTTPFTPADTLRGRCRRRRQRSHPSTMRRRQHVARRGTLALAGLRDLAVASVAG